MILRFQRDLYLGHEFSGRGAQAHLLAVLNPMVCCLVDADANGGKLGMFGPAP